MLVLTGLPAPLGLSTRRGSSQDVMVSLDTAPAWSWSGWLLSPSLAGSEGCVSDMRGSEGLTSLLLRRLLAPGGSRFGTSPPPCLSSCFPLGEGNTSRRFARFSRKRRRKQSRLRLCGAEGTALKTFTKENTKTWCQRLTEWISCPLESVQRNCFLLKSNIDTKLFVAVLSGTTTGKFIFMLLKPSKQEKISWKSKSSQHSDSWMRNFDTSKLLSTHENCDLRRCLSQTHPAGLRKPLLSSLHSDPTLNVFFQRTDSSASGFYRRPSRAAAAAAAAERSLCNPLLQKCVRQPGSMRQRPVACSARRNGLQERKRSAGVWAATGGGESPTALFKRRVNKPANSFTKTTEGLPASWSSSWPQRMQTSGVQQELWPETV